MREVVGLVALGPNGKSFREMLLNKTKGGV